MENNKENTCSCGCCGGHNSCGSACRSINHHSVIRILVGVIVLMVVLFAGFKMGMFFNQALDGGCGFSGYRSGRMMDRNFDGYRQRMMDGSGYYKQINPFSTSTAQ